MWIMIAGPYRTGASTEAEMANHLAALNRAACEVFRRGHTPVVGVNMALPMIEVAGTDSYEEIMMPLSFALAERCDGILRISGVSRGADQEVEVVRSRGGSVFDSAEQVPFVEEANRNR